ncbi:hypothetical protein N7541_001152 [Penicillium brevicompactum]|uniref:Uncharacterized protein n=1 Tax=Penicillium brevicompactum TaxID=5074 RepID=A0A9W9V5P5_PENBR|nr:hypothetical protein N7541_001152 [Penicillium brevicompactum]
MSATMAVGLQDPEGAILMWTKLQVPKDLELNIEWDGLFLPLIQAPGHSGSGWARFENSDTILLVTEWKRTLDQRGFIASPSAQLYHEDLKSKGIVHVSSHETRSSRFIFFDPLMKSYLQFFWIYFTAPVTEAQLIQISKIKSIRGVAILKNFTNDLEKSRDYLHPIKMWANHIEFVDGQEAQLLLWPHFWKSAELAEIRHAGKYVMSGDKRFGSGSRQERVCENLDKLEPMSWKEHFLSFRRIPDI